MKERSKDGRRKGWREEGKKGEDKKGRKEGREGRKGKRKGNRKKLMIPKDNSRSSCNYSISHHFMSLNWQGSDEQA